MVVLNFPQSKAQLLYDGQWHVSKQEGLQLPVVNVDVKTMSAYDLVHSALTLQLVLGIAESYSDKDAVELPEQPNSVNAEWVALNNSKPKRYPTFYNGAFVSYDDVDVPVSAEMLYSWYAPFLPAKSPLYNDFYKPVIPDMWALRAVVTRQAVEYDNGLWKSVDAVNTGWEKVTTPYGYEVYTNNPEAAVPAGGLDALATEVALTYPVAMLSTVPESVFEDLPVEFNTNAHRLLYYLNAGMLNKPKPKPAPVVEAVVETEHEVELPEGTVDVEVEQPEAEPVEASIQLNSGTGTVIAIGGDIRVSDADGVWSTEDVVGFIQKALAAYSSLGVKDGPLLSKYAIESYYNWCNDPSRITQVGGSPDSNVKVQVTNENGRYVWTGASFRPMFGSERTYSKSVSIYKDLVLSYEDGKSVLTTKYIEKLLASFLSVFYPADESTMGVYYSAHLVPDLALSYEGRVYLADDYTKTYVCFDGGQWVPCQVWDGGSRCPATGIRLRVPGEGYINGSDLARIVVAVSGGVMSLLEYRHLMRDEVAVSLGHCKDYETLLSLPQKGITSRKTVMFGMNTIPDAPVILRDATGPIVYSGGEWRRTSVPLSGISFGTGEYLEYSMPIADAEKFLLDFLSLCCYSEDNEVIQTSINIEGRNYHA